MNDEINCYIQELKELVSRCVDEQLAKSETYEKALSNLRHQSFYTLNQYSTELINMVSDEIEKKALNQKISRSKQ